MSKSTADLERAAAAAKRKELQARDSVAAMAEYQAGLKAERSKTEKLRALRMAKEAAEAEQAEAKRKADETKALMKQVVAKAAAEKKAAASDKKKAAAEKKAAATKKRK